MIYEGLIIARHFGCVTNTSYIQIHVGAEARVCESSSITHIYIDIQNQERVDVVGLRLTRAKPHSDTSVVVVVMPT